jgi:hypothetical protein
VISGARPSAGKDHLCPLTRKLGDGLIPDAGISTGDEIDFSRQIKRE